MNSTGMPESTRNFATPYPATRHAAPGTLVDLVVIGAGVAGFSAAVRASGAGLRVVVCEESPRMGGRATAFTDRETGERVDNGQHVLFGCYRETYAFLNAIGAAGLAAPAPRLDVTMAGEDGRCARFACPAWRPPWHLMAGILRARGLPLVDRLGALNLRGFLAGVRRRGAAAAAADVPAGMTVTDWLAGHGQSRRLRDWLWNPLAFAALNQSPDEAAAAPFARVLGELVGPRVEDSAIGLPRVPLDELFATPARAFLEERQGRVLLKTPARVQLDRDGRVRRVLAGGAAIDTRAVISAVPWHALGRIWDGGPPDALRSTIANAAATPGSPIVTVNLWFDAAVMDTPFMGLVGGPMHWVFDRRAIVGARAGHLSVVASGARDLAAMDNAAVTREAMAHLSRALPATSARRLVRAVVVREHRATFSLSPGAPPRPAATTAVPGLFLAGDWTDTGLPATIEGAVLSGHRAADLVCESLQ